MDSQSDPSFLASPRGGICSFRYCSRSSSSLSSAECTRPLETVSGWPMRRCDNVEVREGTPYLYVLKDTWYPISFKAFALMEPNL